MATYSQLIDEWEQFKESKIPERL
nr:hypothetical protein pLG2-0006 [Enterococcus faecalis]